MILRKENIDFKLFANELLGELSSNIHEDYAKGYAYYVSELFSSLDHGGILVFQIDIGIYDLDLPIVIESILRLLCVETDKLKISQKSHFLAGVEAAIQSSTRALELASLQSENNQAA